MSMLTAAAASTAAITTQNESHKMQTNNNKKQNCFRCFFIVYLSKCLFERLSDNKRKCPIENFCIYGKGFLFSETDQETRDGRM